ncbi:MAG: transcriptional repressor LexA [Clostridia bacterium]|jgi:repressor LexA|nr:transcriptional repressor LexA [Clostridia bacterium]
MKETLSDKQQKILDFLKSEIKSKGYPPSVREICLAVGLRSTSTVHGHLERLEKKGYIRKSASKTRAIEILEDNFYSNELSKEYLDVPVVGKITAGEPILAVENVEDHFPIPVDYANNNDVFMLKVSGDSMIEAGIYDGDLILVNKQNTARNGEIVVALIEDSATVKTFYKEQDHFRLQPENSSLDPIIVKDLEILGTVSGLFRKY